MTAAVVILCVVIAVQSILHHIERKDLYNRIMCRDINEYKNVDKPMKAHISAHRRVMDKWKDRGDNQ